MKDEDFKRALAAMEPCQAVLRAKGMTQFDGCPMWDRLMAQLAAEVTERPALRWDDDESDFADRS